MSDIRLYRLQGSGAREIRAGASDLEKPLQNLIESNLEVVLGVRFLATEYPTGKTHGGRIDTLGIDENGCPVILEYKRSLNENVINQGLYYLDWLLDHKAEFWKLTAEKFGKEAADSIEWSGPRLICIASDFTKYDEHAVQQINRNIELIRYRKFDSDLLLFELVNAVTAMAVSKPNTSGKKTVPKEKQDWEPSWTDWWPKVPEAKVQFDVLQDYVLSLGDDVQMKYLKQYIAFKRIKNFCTVVSLVKPQRLLLCLSLDPDSVEIDPAWMRDVRQIGHWGTGYLELSLTSREHLEKAKALVLRAYEGG